MLSKYSTFSYCKWSESIIALWSIFPSKAFNVFVPSPFHLFIFVLDGQYCLPWRVCCVYELLSSRESWISQYCSQCVFFLHPEEISFLILFPLLLLSLPIWLFLKLFFYYLLYSLSQKAVKLVTSNLPTEWQHSDFKFALAERYQTCSLLKQFCDPTILHLMLYLQAGFVLCLFTSPVSRAIILSFPPYQELGSQKLIFSFPIDTKKFSAQRVKFCVLRWLG